MTKSSSEINFSRFHCFLWKISPRAVPPTLISVCSIFMHPYNGCAHLFLGRLQKAINQTYFCIPFKTFYQHLPILSACFCLFVCFVFNSIILKALLCYRITVEETHGMSLITPIIEQIYFV